MAKTGLKEITIVAIGLTLSSVGAVCAQTANPLPASELSTLSAKVGAPVVESSTPIPAARIDSAQPTARLRDLQRLASSAGMSWEKVYKVSPAGIDAPVTTLADARQMADQPGTVTFAVRDVPAASAIRTVATADDAQVDLADTLRMGNIDVDLSDASVPDAIAALAKRTHTHWAVEYVVGPVAGPNPGHNNVAFGPKPRMTQQQYEETQLFNGPVNIQVAPPPPVTTVAAKPAAPAAAAGTTAAPGSAATNATPAPNPYSPYAPAYSPYESYGMYPYGTGYAPYGFGAGPYQSGPYQIAPGLTVQPGNPWAGNQSLVFGG